MADATPTHIGDVEQAIDAAEIHKRTEVGNIFHNAATDLACLKRFHELLFAFCPFLLDKGTARNNDVASGLVDLEHEALDRTAAIIADVGRPSDVDLACWQENIDARNVDEQTTLDFSRYKAGDHVILVDAFHDAQPVFDATCFAF